MKKSDGVDKAMSILQDRSLTNELNYQFVMDCLKDYSFPRSKLTHLLNSGALIHVKKGLYLLGSRFRRTPYIPELLANMIYGPSYVSLEYALQTYGLIPEHVVSITSVSMKASKAFQTPVGYFSYTHCYPKSYSVGITLKKYSPNENALIATPEKALTDMLTLRRGKVTSLIEMEKILLEDLRIDENDLYALDINMVRKIYRAHPHSAIHFLEKWLEKNHE